MPDYVAVFYDHIRQTGNDDEEGAVLAVARAAYEHCAQIADSLAEGHRMAIIGEAAHEIRRQARELK